MEKQGADAPGVLTLTTSLSTVCTDASPAIHFRSYSNMAHIISHLLSDLILRRRDNNDNNALQQCDLTLLITFWRQKLNVFLLLKDLFKFKIQCMFGRPLLHNELQLAVYYRHYFCTNFEKVREQNIKFYAD